MAVYTEIPWYDGDEQEWKYKTFGSRDALMAFVAALFKEPGQYGFDETSFLFNEQARFFKQHGYYCNAPFKSRDYVRYWDLQKERNLKGVIFTHGDKTWYLTRDYYMWLNFLPIYHKEKKKYDFPDVRDVQYHLALYECLAELKYKHAVILKKRQIASSYFHAGKLINGFWFNEGYVGKMGASLKDYINEKGTWLFLNEYANFLDTHTAWYRPRNPAKVFAWYQEIEVNVGGRKQKRGLKSRLSGMSFEKDPTNGVGGPCVHFFHEEAGIAPKMNNTYEYVRPALQDGQITTGMFIAAGSVGDLDQCQPLKTYLLKPEENGFLGIETNLLDDKGTTALCGLFLPEQWGMPPFIDAHGNSMVGEALAAILAERKQWKKDLEPDQYQLRISQKPTNISEAFALRKASKFPIHLLQQQLRRIEEKEYPYEILELDRNAEGKIEVKESRKQPIREFPVPKNFPNKEGAFMVWERPLSNVPWGTYYASIDPVSEGKAEYIYNMVYTPTGRKKIGELVPGEYVIGSNGKPTRVIGVYPQGIKELYRVTFTDGASVLVCKEHLWSLRSNGGERRDEHVLSVAQLMDKDNILQFKGIGFNSNKHYTIPTYYKKNAKGDSRWRIPVVKPIEFEARKLPVHPYLLGLLLGDGGLSTRSVRFTTADDELVQSIQTILPNNVTINKRYGKYDYHISTHLSRNPLTKQLRMLGLMGKRSEHKSIPEDYFYGTIQDRLALLQGLMDTDGYCGNHGSEFYSVSEQLANGVVELVRSLGGIAKIRRKNIVPKNKPKDKYGKGYCYVVRVMLPEPTIPFRLSRKCANYYPPKVFSRYISDIQFEKMGEAVCIKVAAIDSLYVTEHAIVTHNTSTSESLCSLYVYKNPIELTSIQKDGRAEVRIEGGKVVAAWCGRYEDINDTHKLLELVIEWYNAWTIVEVNVSLFIQHMIAQRKQRYLVPKDQIVFLKEIGANRHSYQEYGWKNTGSFFKEHLLNYAIEFCKEVIDQDLDEQGNVIRSHYGVERIMDPMLLTEMGQYQEGVNVDRLVAFTALVAFVKVQIANRGYRKVREDAKNSLENQKDLYKLKLSPFRSMGQVLPGMKRSAFKNLR